MSLNWKINCGDHSSLSSTTTVQIWLHVLHINIHIIDEEKDKEDIRTDIKYMITFAKLINYIWDIRFEHAGFSLWNESSMEK